MQTDGSVIGINIGGTNTSFCFFIVQLFWLRETILATQGDGEHKGALHNSSPGG